MITFITNYDDNTNCNYAAYCHFAIFPSLELLESNAIASRLSQESLSERRNIFAMSHGTKDELKDQDRIAGSTHVIYAVIPNISEYNFLK